MDTAGIEPRPAATVMLLRDSSAGPEVLMLRRTNNSVFVPGVLLFPGGALEEDELSGNPCPDEASYRLAGARETLEEAGVLVCVEPDASAEVASTIRAALFEGERSFPDLLADAGLSFVPERMVFVSRWVTPPGRPRRYDTRFYACAAPPRAEAQPDGVEATEALWLRPRDALRLARTGEESMILPTVANLEVLEHAGDGTDVGGLLQRLRNRSMSHAARTKP